MSTTETSRLAREKFEASGDRNLHYGIILFALQDNVILTNYGIAKKAYYEDKEGRTRKISYHQVARRSSELRKQGKIEEVCKMRDDDGTLRMGYRLK